jgi:hypothetical protein
MLCGFRVKFLEIQLLKENPLWLLILRNDPAALTNQVDAFEISFRKLMVLEGHCRGISLALCIFLFPFGLLTLAGQDAYTIKCKTLRIISLVLLPLVTTFFIISFAFRIYPLGIIFALPFILLVLLLVYLRLTERMQQEVAAEDSSRYASRRLVLGVDPHFSVYQF